MTTYTNLNLVSTDELQTLYNITAPVSNSGWLEFARRFLELNEEEIKSIKGDGQQTFRQQRKEMLKAWQDKNSRWTVDSKMLISFLWKKEICI